MKDFGKWTQLEQIRARRAGSKRFITINNKQILVITKHGIHDRVIKKAR